MRLIETQPAAQLGVTSEPLLPGAELTVQSVLVGDNWGAVDPAMGVFLRRDVYQPRLASLAAIDLVRLPAPVLVQGGSFAATAAGIWVQEQVHPDWADAGMPDRADVRSPVIEVQAETVLVGRYGVSTWGHWLGELLPRMVLTERRFPNRFRYALPRALLTEPTGTVWDAMRQSIAAYGIPLDRCIPLDAGTAYAFSAAWCQTPVWSDRMMHPAAVLMLRDNIRLPVPACDLPAGQVALLRTDTTTRQLVNLPEIADLLGEAGFPTVPVGRLPFVQQVALFRAARRIVSVLGSGLTGLIYAPEGIGVVSIAPRDFGDCFFYALVQNRRGTYADIRGEAQPGHEHLLHWGPFSVNPGALRDGMAAAFTPRA